MLSISLISKYSSIDPCRDRTEMDSVYSISKSRHRWFIDMYCRYKANFWETYATFNRYCRIGNMSSSWNSRNERNNVKSPLCGRQSITGRAREELFVPLTRVQARLENRRVLFVTDVTMASWRICRTFAMVDGFSTTSNQRNDRFRMRAQT